MTSEVNVAFAGRTHRPARERELHAAPALEATDVRDLHTGRTRRGSQRALLARRYGNHEFVVVAAAQHIGPQFWNRYERSACCGRQRDTLAFDHDTKPRGFGNMAGVGPQAGGDIRRRPWRAPRGPPPPA